MEVWKDINGYEGLYQISNYGNVRSLDRYVNGNNGSKALKKGIVLKKQITNKGYYDVGLYKNGKAKYLLVHRLVAEHFIPNPENKRTVNHKDGNKLNNHVSNLEWVTHSENQIHAFNNGLQKTTKKQKDVRSRSAIKFNIGKSKPVYQIDENGNIIRLWLSCTHAGKYGFSKSSINKCCQGKMKKHKGYMWKYIKDVDNPIMIIVDGCDCTGKTTLINELSRITGFKALKGSDFNIAEQGTEKMYEFMLSLSRLNESVILDRYFISNLVYAPMYNANMLKENHIKSIINEIKRKSITIYLFADEDIIRNRMINRSDDYININDIGEILSRYKEKIDEYKNDITILEFDTGIYSSNEIANMVKEMII